MREGIYHYDPENYHGPTIYYFSAFIPWVLRFFFGTAAQDKYGLNTITIRLVPALFGLATVWLVLILRRHIGSIGTLAAAALIAVSPGSVYLSRYFIHETLFVFFTLGLVVAALKYYDSGQPIYLVLAAISAALLFATKETAIISAGVLIIALAVTQAYRFIRRRDLDNRLHERRANKRSPLTTGTDRKTRAAGQTRRAVQSFTLGPGSDRDLCRTKRALLLVLLQELSGGCLRCRAHFSILDEDRPNGACSSLNNLRLLDDPAGVADLIFGDDRRGPCCLETAQRFRSICSAVGLWNPRGIFANRI